MIKKFLQQIFKGRLIPVSDDKDKKSRGQLRVYIDKLPWRFFKRLALVQVIFTVLAIVAMGSVARWYINIYMTNQTRDQMYESLVLVRHTLTTHQMDPVAWCRSFKKSWNTRYTLINWDGEVLCDNYKDISLLVNHADRPEVKEARQFGMGSSLRVSESINEDMIYGAIVYEDVTRGRTKYFIRQAIPLKRVHELLSDMQWTIFLFLSPLIVIALFLSFWATLQVASPLKSILKKVDKMRKLGREYKEEQNYLIAPNNEWLLVEKTLERAKRNLEKNFKELGREHSKLAVVMESISDAILAINRHQNILFANEHFKDLFLPREHAREALFDHKIWETLRNHEIQELFDETLEKRKTLKRSNLPLLVKNGSDTYFFDLTVSPLIDHRGKIFGAVCVFHDVTARRLAEQMREDFVANVSHEVRTPLTALKGYAQLIKSTPAPERERLNEYLERIESNSDRLTVLFNDILNLSVIESRQKISKEMVETEEITESALVNVRQSYPKHTTKVHTSYETTQIWANAQFLDQVITNLLDNAYKYSQCDGNIWITWKSSEFYDVLEILDDGPGIAKEHHPRLFERFYRVDPSRSSEIKGSGLGLAIVKHIVSKHEGKINVENGPDGKGTLFRVKFPRHPESITIVDAKQLRGDPTTPA